MKIDGNREFDLLQKIGFIRTSGSAEEFKAAEILKAEAEALGVRTEIEPFSVEDAVIENAALEVLEPYQKSYTVTAYKCAQNTPQEGITADFLYAENMTEADLAAAKGKIVLVNGYMRLVPYKRLVAAGVAGFITMSGTLLDKEDETDLFTRKIRAQLETFGLLPGVNLRAADAFELVQKGASKVRLTVQNKRVTLTSHNVIATIDGTEHPEEIISFGAHYDSVPFSTGVYDNGAGSVINMEILRYFAENKPQRTVKFMWYGSEEVGLEGSKAYVAAHADELPRHKFMINVDVGGPVLGYDIAVVTGEKSVVAATDFFMKTHGYGVEVKQDTYSSDSIPFADSGIPAINFCRNGADGGAFIHCRNDVIDYLSADALAKTTAHVLDYAETVINAPAFPIERTMPAEMIEAIDKYLYKKELASAK